MLSQGNCSIQRVFLTPNHCSIVVCFRCRKAKEGRNLSTGLAVRLNIRCGQLLRKRKLNVKLYKVRTNSTAHETGRIVILQVHPRSLILPPIETAYEIGNLNPTILSRFSDITLFCTPEATFEHPPLCRPKFPFGVDP